MIARMIDENWSRLHVCPPINRVSRLQCPYNDYGRLSCKTELFLNGSQYPPCPIILSFFPEWNGTEGWHPRIRNLSGPCSHSETTTKDFGVLRTRTAEKVRGSKVSSSLREEIRQWCCTMGTIRPQIVLFGDSLTEYAAGVTDGWTTSLTNYYNRKADVMLRGFGGYNTRLARLLLDKIFPLPSSNPPLLVTVFFGANDAADPNANHGVVHVPVAEYAENLHEIVAHLKKLSGSTKIVLITPPPICEKNLIKSAQILYADSSGVPTRKNELTKLYAQECVKVGQETNVPVIDLWSTFQEVPDWEEKYLCDGLHLTSEGNAKVFEELVKILDDRNIAPTVRAEQMRWDFPPWYKFGEDPVSTVKSWCSQSSL